MAAGISQSLEEVSITVKGEIPSKDWQREIRRLYHLIKAISADLKLPPLREFHHEVGSGAWMESKY